MDNEEFIKGFKKAKPHLLDIDYLIREVKWGKIHLELTVQNGRVTAVDVISRQRIDYSKGETARPED